MRTPPNSSGSRSLTEPDGQHRDGYDPTTVDQLVGEAANILKAIGYASDHVVLIGGLVPGLLVPVLDPGLEPHVGTADIDLCLSVALVDGDTAEYQRIETELKRLGFQEGDATFRWIRDRNTGLPLTIEFFCPAAEGRPAGRTFRPPAATNPRAKYNLGGKLSALALEAGELLTTDVEIITRTVALPDNKGTFDATLRVTGPLAFLVAKADALTKRDKPKDAYDIVWLIESWQGGPAAAADAFAARPAYTNPAVIRGLQEIAKAFSEPSTHGSRSYAQFSSRNVAEDAQLELRAVGAVAEFMRALPPA